VIFAQAAGANTPDAKATPASHHFIITRLHSELMKGENMKNRLSVAMVALLAMGFWPDARRRPEVT
jgi:hypothetical protein